MEDFDREYYNDFQHAFYSKEENAETENFSDLTHEEKLTLLFDFYMWMTNGELDLGSKKNPHNYCPFTYMEDIDKCSRFNNKTFCSEFKFISSKDKSTCPCHQHGEKALGQLYKLLVHEGFIPTKREIKK
jgi:hypothetical protein